MTRSAMMSVMDGAAERGQISMQRCGACRAVQYPPRELCCVCLSSDLHWESSNFLEGEVIATTMLHHSHEPSFRPHLPVRLGMVRLDDGPSALCFVPQAGHGVRVRVTAALDGQGRAVLTAEPVA